MIDLGSIAGLHSRNHQLHCPTCDRWATLPLADADALDGEWVDAAAPNQYPDTWPGSLKERPPRLSAKQPSQSSMKKKTNEAEST